MLFNYTHIIFCSYTFSIDSEEIFAVSSPFWQFNILKNNQNKAIKKVAKIYINSFSILAGSKVKLLRIDQKTVIFTIELRNELFDNCMVIYYILNKFLNIQFPFFAKSYIPIFFHAKEESIWLVKLSTLYIFSEILHKKKLTCSLSIY